MTQIPIEKEVEVITEDVKSPTIKDEETDYMVQLKIAQAYYKFKGYEVLLGHDFEENLITFVSPEDSTDRMLLDEYTKIKLWKKKKTPEIVEYSQRIIDVIGEEKTKQILFICRLCSFLGGPGFPEIILIKDNKMELRFIKIDDLLKEQKFFSFFVKDLLQVCDIKVSEVIPNTLIREEKKASCTIKELLEEGKSGDRADMYLKELDELIKKEDNEDEKKYLQDQRYNIPFFMFVKWSNDGKVDSKDIEEHFKKINEIAENKRKDFIRFHSEIIKDEEYMNLGPMRDNNTMKKKKEYIEKKFNLGDTRAKNFLKFITSL
ncbi:MAG: hypothetical protein ABIJ92_01055 [Candidatus Aenigmatarchaeota archaeon]